MPKVVRICPRRSCDDEKKKVPLHSGQGEELLRGLRRQNTPGEVVLSTKSKVSHNKSHTHATVKSQKSSQAKSMYELKYMYLVYYEARRS